MMDYGFVKVAAGIPSMRVADVRYNVDNIKVMLQDAEDQGVSVIVMPELCITGYTCQDLFFQQTLLREAENGVRELVEWSADKDVVAIVGAPVAYGGVLMNAAIVVQGGDIIGMVPKTFLPNYNEFYEQRWFTSAKDLGKLSLRYADCWVDIDGQEAPLFSLGEDPEMLFGIELCEDLWSPVPPSNTLTLKGADVIFNLSASNELVGKHDYLVSLIAGQSARTLSAYVYSSCGFGESTQDVVYGGNAIIAENGNILAASRRFDYSPQMSVAQVDVERLRAERRKNTSFRMAQRGMTAEISYVADAENEHPFVLDRYVDPHPFIPGDAAAVSAVCEEIFNIQTSGLAKRLVHTHSKHAVVGISGGLDSTLALLVCVKTFDKLGYDRKGIVGVTMPGFGTTDRTYHNAMSLMKSLGVTIREISIRDSVTQHFKDIDHDINNHNVVYENGQARERTQILMDISNQVGGLVIGTGDLSELALGWATYNGDHMSMYGVNASIPKTLIKYLVRYVADTDVDKESAATLMDVLDTPISPELIPADEQGNIKQKTEDLVGPYELHDFFLYHFLRFGFTPKKIFLLARKAFDSEKYSDETIKHWLVTFLRRFFQQQFKRSCLPDGPKVGSVTLSPRGDWRMPSDASSEDWLREAESL